ncbi:hypothetical protein BKA62DRAFT_298006 [Auriculariales sp. MPI-PUGE-AT-0066]|nr:hypothetical protein BKA62DRAFT_298006 [Auriculariales sp. MPI-PUGE-AT-0066]
MSNLAAQVKSSANQHASILNELASLDYASSALPNAESYARDLGALVRTAETKVKDARKKVTKERKDHLEIKDAGFKRFAHKIVGKGDKFDKKVSKEEKEFLEAQEHLLREEHNLENLKRNHKDAEHNIVELKAANTRREQLQRELDALYGRVFDGPTPEAHQDDELEAAVRTAIATNDEKQGALNYEGQSVSMLGQARNALIECESHLREASDHSDMDIWGFGGIAADMLEHNAIYRAQAVSTTFLNLLAQARSFNPSIGDVPPPKIPRPNMTEVYFDNIFSDLAAAEKIDAAIRSAAKSKQLLKSEMDKLETRVNQAAITAGISADAVVQARQKLHDFRARTFQEVLNSESGAAPSYSGEFPSTPNAQFRSASPQPNVLHEADQGVGGFRVLHEADQGVGGFRAPGMGGQLFSPPAGPPPGRYAPPSGLPPPGAFSTPAGTPSVPQPRQYAPPSGPPPSSSAPAPSFGFPAFIADPTVRAHDEQKPNESHSAAPSFPVFSTEPYSAPSSSAAPSWPVFSAEPVGGAALSTSGSPDAKPITWGSMNPYAAHLLKRGTSDDMWWKNATPAGSATSPTPAATSTSSSSAPGAGHTEHETTSVAGVSSTGAANTST